MSFYLNPNYDSNYIKDTIQKVLNHCFKTNEKKSVIEIPHIIKTRVVELFQELNLNGITNFSVNPELLDFYTIYDSIIEPANHYTNVLLLGRLDLLENQVSPIKSINNKYRFINNSFNFRKDTIYELD